MSAITDVITPELEALAGPPARSEYINPVRKGIGKGATAEQALHDCHDRLARLGADTPEAIQALWLAYLEVVRLTVKKEG